MTSKLSRLITLRKRKQLFTH
uniref:Uncharacterized protein n=1 Tax=mine drainage metagenome TaxID=410659 RepID=E6QCT0_9ZZZZ